MGLRSIGRVLKVSNVTVLYWIRNLGKSIKTYVQTEMPDDIRHVDMVELDEMWHFIDSKKRHGSKEGNTFSIFSKMKRVH